MSESEQSEEIQEEVLETEEIVETAEVAEEAESEEKIQSKSQDAKQRLRRKVRQSEAEVSRLTDEIASQNTRFAELESKVDKVINPPSARPSRVDFETEEDYEDALYDYRTPSKVEAQEVRPAQEGTQTPQQAIAPDVQKNWDNQCDNMLDKHEDYEDVISSISADNMTDPMTQSIVESEFGGEIAYFLGNNPAEARRISGMSFVGQVNEINRLGNKFSTTTTNAPDPITPTKGQDTAIKNVDSMSAEEYRDYRRSGGMSA